MASFNDTTRTQSGWNWELPQTAALRLGRRELSIGRDLRRRYDDPHPVLDCRPGVDKGHLELLLFRRWCVVLSKAH